MANHASQRGGHPLAFTYLELVTTVGILALLAAAILPAFRNYERRIEVRNHAEELRDLLSEAASFALSPRGATTGRIRCYQVRLRLGDDPATIERESVVARLFELADGGEAEVVESTRRFPAEMQLLPSQVAGVEARYAFFTEVFGIAAALDATKPNDPVENCSEVPRDASGRLAFRPICVVVHRQFENAAQQGFTVRVHQETSQVELLAGSRCLT